MSSDVELEISIFYRSVLLHPKDCLFMCCWICVFNVVVCAAGFLSSILWIVLLELRVPCCGLCCRICVFRFGVCVFGFEFSMLRFVLLYLDVSCCVLFSASTEVINKPPGDCTPLYSCQTPFVGTGCTNSCLSVNNASSCRGPLNKTSTIGIQVGVCS